MMKINETFLSLQGEGLMMGSPTVFVRLAGCNLDCSWCDTQYARGDDGEEMTIESILSKVESCDTKVVCVTGGEPLLHQKDALHLINKLLDRGYFVSVETNGSIPIDSLPCTEQLLISMDIKCPSSGMENEMCFENLEVLGLTDQLKFVLADKKDYKYAKGIIEEYAPACTIIMTPVGGLDLKWLAEKVLEDKLHVRVLPQLHKIIWGDEKGK